LYGVGLFFSDIFSLKFAIFLTHTHLKIFFLIKNLQVLEPNKKNKKLPHWLTGGKITFWVLSDDYVPIHWHEFHNEWTVVDEKRTQPPLDRLLDILSGKRHFYILNFGEK